MSNASNQIDQQVQEIEFIDPNEFIEFIQDENLDLDSTESELSEQSASVETPVADRLREISSEYITRKREDTRERLATIYISATFVLFFLVIIVSVIDGIARGVSIVDNLSTILPVLSGIFLGTLGFILGYYFRKGEDN